MGKYYAIWKRIASKPGSLVEGTFGGKPVTIGPTMIEITDSVWRDKVVMTINRHTGRINIISQNLRPINIGTCEKVQLQDRRF